MASAADRSGEPEHVTGESQLPADPPQARRRRALTEAIIALIAVLLLASGLLRASGPDWRWARGARG
jgi:hypothetical protein